jgi:hypothetical protein
MCIYTIEIIPIPLLFPNIDLDYIESREHRFSN